MAGEMTYQLRCNGCGCVYRPSSKITPAPKMLQEVRRLAAKKSWKHDVVVVGQGPGPSLDFCRKCDTTGVRAEVIMGVLAGKWPEHGASHQGE